MKTRSFLFVLALVSCFCCEAFAGNFWPGKLPEPGNTKSLEQVSTGSVVSSEADQGDNLRNADVCGRLNEWKDSLVLEELKDGKAEHMDPAEALVLSTEENDGNIVTMLALMGLSIAPDGRMSLFAWNKDGEYQLLIIMNYGSNQVDRHRWYGTVPQWVGTSYQYALEDYRRLTFKQAFKRFTDRQGNWSEFRARYAWYAQMMNYYLRYYGASSLSKPNPYPLEPGSGGYYHHFQSTPQNRKQMITAVRKFFRAMGWPLADPELFKKPGSPSIISYDAPGAFCK